MPYTPPAGNAVVFNFPAGGYLPPGGNSVIFNFGGGVPPPPSTANSAARHQLQFFEDDWFIAAPRRFTPITAFTTLTPFKRVIPRIDYDDDWLWQHRPINFVPRKRIRIALFTIT